MIAYPEPLMPWKAKEIVMIKKTTEDRVNACYEEPPSPHHFNRREVVEESSGLTRIVSSNNYKRHSNTWGKPRRLHEARSKARLLSLRTPRVGWVVYPLVRSRVRMMVRIEPWLCVACFYFIVFWYRSHFCPRQQVRDYITFLTLFLVFGPFCTCLFALAL